MASTVWRGFVTFGLISIPVRLFRAARAERVSFRRMYRAEAPQAKRERASTFAEPAYDAEEEEERRPGISAVPHPDLAPVQQVSVREGTETVLPQQSVVKGYEYEKNRFVVVDPEELKSIAPKTATEMEIQEFVQLNEIDPVYFETSYYAVPEEAGQKAYALLYRSLQTSGLVALAQFAMHSREHVVVLRPGRTGIIAHTMFYSTEVRADEEYRADASAVTQKELDLAQMLIHSLAAPFEPAKYHDTYREKVESIIARKVAGQPAAPVDRPVRSSSVVDITEALQKSLAALKKPATSERSTSKPAKKAASKKMAGGA
jgi:DNA end-binding protein Ku